MRIAVIGLGKLGSVLAAVLAEAGYTVIGVDIDPRPVNAVRQGRAPVREPGLEELIARNRQRLSATMDCEQAAAEADITFIVAPTPSEPDGAFSMRHVLAAAEPLGRALARAQGFRVVVLSSTVLPGSTGGLLQPALESASGKRCGEDFGLCYNPEFIALGTVARDIRNPDIVLIGESDPRSGELLEALYRRVCVNGAPVRRMNFVNAELAKISVNTYVTLKISYANMLAGLCERLPGADVDVVTAAVGGDSRIGTKCLKGGLGYGGPCFPRDNLALDTLARRLGTPASLGGAADQLNRRQVDRLLERVLSLLEPGQTAGVLGLSYKPLTGVVEESQGLMLALRLREKNIPLIVHDPEAMENARRQLDEGVRFADSMEECAAGAHVLVLATPWEQFKSLRPEHMNHSCGRPVLVDCWRLLPREDFGKHVRYVAVGVAAEPETLLLAKEAVHGVA